MRRDLNVLARWIRPGARVLDLGCGGGELLQYLMQHKQVTGLGMDIDPDNVLQCIERGVPVVHQDLNVGLANMEAHRFDTVVMSLSLQQLQAPDSLLDDMLRVAADAIVSFPNFGHWTTRVYLGLRGRMPMSVALPYRWYNTPNIHLCTFKDFEILCQQKGIRIVNRQVVDSQMHPSLWTRCFPNLLGEIALYHITSG